MKNKKGFTLIELLAVIVILAIIMVIAVPQILNVIDSSRTSAWNDSVKLIKNAIETNTTLFNPNTGLPEHTLNTLCKSDATSEISKIADVGDMTISCLSNTFTLTGVRQFDGKEAVITCTSISDGTNANCSSDGSSTGGSSGGSGGSEPAANYTYISPTNPSGGPELASGETIWLQTNNTSNIMEVCAVFPNGTLCFNETDFNVDKNGRAVNGDKTSAFNQKVSDLGGSVFYLNGDANISSSDKICTYSLSTYGCSNKEYTYSCSNNYGNIVCKDER